MLEYKYLTTANIVFNQELTKVALIRRPANKAFPNTLALPGGKLLENENFKDAAIRETVEEIGFKPHDVFFSNIYEAQGYFMTCYYCRAESEKDIDTDHWHDLSRFYALKLAPNVGKACKDAYEKALLSYKSDTFSLIDETISLAAKYIYKHPIEINGERGWDHHLLNRRIGIIGTAIGLVVTGLGGYREDYMVKAALSKLLKMGNEDGGWSTKSLAGPSILESTYYCTKALHLHTFDSDRLQRSFDWIKAQQNPDGGWGSRYGNRSRLLTTTFAIELMRISGAENRSTQGFQWILRHQNEDGSWGECANNAAGTSSHTARAMISLLESGHSQVSPEIIKAVNWLRDEYMRPQRWRDSSEMEYLEIENQDSKRIHFTHSVYPLALKALIMAGISFSDGIIVKELFKIIEEGHRQHYWEHHTATKFTPIWNSLEHLDLLLKIKDRSSKIIADLLSEMPSGNSDVQKFNLLFHTALSNKNIFKKEDSEEEPTLSRNKEDSNRKIKTNVRNLIAENRIERAVEVLLDHFSNHSDKREEQNSLIMLSGELALVQSQQRNGLPINDINKQLSQLRMRLLTITDSSL